MIEYDYQYLIEYANDLAALSAKIKRFLKDREEIKQRIAINLDSSYDLNSLLQTYENEITKELNNFKSRIVDSTTAIRNEFDSTSYIQRVKEDFGIVPIRDITSIVEEPIIRTK